MFGQWVAMSIIQDRFGCPIFSPSVYQYMVSGVISNHVSHKDIPDPTIKHIVSLVSFCH